MFLLTSYEYGQLDKMEISSSCFSYFFRFDVYCEQIRMEYAYVPLTSFLEKRAQFLEKMAAAAHIYKTAAFKKLEDAARSNCRNEAARLRQMLERR